MKYRVYTKSGRVFDVEEMGHSHTNWGNLNPATGKIEPVKAKHNETVTEETSTITEANGYRNIAKLAKGVSPLAYIDQLDETGVDRIEQDGVTYPYER